MVQVFGMVTVVTAAMFYSVHLGFFDSVHTEIGRQFYAERYSAKWRKIFPPWLNMPYNAFVNIGYVILGAFYCAKTSASGPGYQTNKTIGQFFILHVQHYVYFLWRHSSGKDLDPVSPSSCNGPMVHPTFLYVGLHMVPSP